MPETTIDAPQPTDNPSAVVDEMGTMLAAFDAPPAPPPDKPTDDKGAPPPTEPKAKPEGGKPTEQPKGQPTDKTPEKPVSGPAQLRNRLAEIEKEYAGFKNTAAQEQEKLQRQLKEYEKRPYLTKEQQERYDALEKREKALEAELYSRDYRESPEFAEKYQKRWESAYKSAVQRVSGLSVESEDAETGEKTSRRVTESDFNKVRSAAPEEQFPIAEKLFGRYAYVVMQDINSLRGIEDAANEEIQNRTKTYHSKRQELYGALQKQSEEYQAAHEEIDRALVEKYPGYFGESKEEPEITAALQHGLKTVDEAMSAADTMTPQMRAAKAAVIRRWAGAFPSLVLRLKRAESKLKEKDDELAKYRASDPGSGGDGGGAAPKGGENGEEDLDAMAKRFDS